ncbi:TetR/AcrR family transcriptional regulator [Alloalcanivorax profundimaris]|nr:TetR/AcrR family transcriptional regulator [Alloalcanivorax profundimaris]
MGARPKHRDNLIYTAARLFRQQGYAATGINDILREAGAPKGSFYHYFPGGKEELGAAAIRHAMGLSRDGTLGGIKGLVTVNLGMDFLGTARVGQWLEVRGVQGPGLDRAAPVTPPVSAPPPRGRRGVFCSFRSGAGGGPGLRTACWWE